MHRFDDLERAANIEQALRERNPSLALAGAELGMMNCAEKLAMRPSEMSRRDIQALRGAVLKAGRISEILQTGRHSNCRVVSNQGEFAECCVNSDDDRPPTRSNDSSE